ncbi:CusA/CzcA family heavy metal efflux RND transporter [Ravibacter arvi]|uniref:CusA/CzcA family heavy metal efflux RND transporter n=1 Tax=Ravibacter arvi TaxID=2051041 RepID=A0ABP8MBE9_9BACT
MLNRIISFSIHNKVVVGFLVLGLMVWGGFSVSQLPIDAVPDITNNQVQIITTSPSLSASDVERLITFPIETSTATIPDVTEIRSISRFGLSVVTLVFPDDTDPYWARQQITERLANIASEVPPALGVPGIAPHSSGLGEIYQYILHPKKGYEKQFSATELRSIQDWIVRRQLLGVKGIADVSSFGGHLKQYEVSVDPDKLRSLNLTLADIFTALEKNNQNTGGAYIDKRPNAWFVRSEGLISSLEDISKIKIRNNPNGLPVTISDVGTVQFGHAVRYGALTYNDEGEAVGGIVMMLKGENSSKVIDQVKERMEQIKATLPEGVVLEAFLDRSHLVDRAIKTVTTNLVEGALIVIFVLVLLLGNWRAGLIVASVIPLAMLFAISMMRLFGVSGNLMSLGAIDFGLIVDGAVIVVEATLHHLSRLTPGKRLTAAEMDQQVFKASSRIRNSAAFGEIIILIVYLPLLTLSGIEGKMFKPMAQTISFAILGAFILSLTYVPMMSALVLPKVPQADHKISNNIIAFLQRNYSKALSLALRFQRTTLGITFVMLAVAIFVFNRLGGEFIPQLDEGDFAIQAMVLPGSSLSESVATSTKTAQALLKHFPNEVREVVGKIGTGEIPTDPMPMEANDMMVLLHPKEKWKVTKSKEELANAMQNKLKEEVPGVAYGFQQPIQMRFNELMTGIRQDVGIKIYGDDLKTLAELAQKVGRISSSVGGAEDLYVETITGLPQVVVRYDYERLAQFGIDIDVANQTIQSAFAGGIAGLVYEGERRYDLVVRLAEVNRQDLASVKNLFVTTPHGEQVPLENLANVTIEPGINQIQRDGTRRRAIVAFNVRGRDVEGTVKELREKVKAQLKLPVGYYITYGGQFQNLEEAKERLVIAVPVALGLIFALLYFTFKSFRHSLLIFTAVPLSAIGGILALELRDMPFSISAGVGFIALFGVAVLNGIVLIAEFNSLRKEGMTDLMEVIRTGTNHRLRAVVLTASVASLGFLPMAVSQSAGAEVQRPLATVVIGGIITASLLTLLVLPILYLRIEKLSIKGAPGKIAAVLLLLLAGTAVPEAKAQEISLEDALVYAQKNNLRGAARKLRISGANAAIRSAKTPGNTSFGFGIGQFDSYQTDNQFSLQQTLPHPAVARRRSTLYQQHYEEQQNINEVETAQLVKEVKLSYQKWYYLDSLGRLLEMQGELLSRAVSFAEAKLKAGESGMLEVNSAKSRHSEIQTRTDLVRQEQKEVALYLQFLLNFETPVIPKREVFTLLPGPANDEVSASGHPELRYWERQVQVRKAETSLLKASGLPDFTFGFSSHTLTGSEGRNGVIYGLSKRFQTIDFGLSLPLFRGPLKAKVKSSEILEEAAQMDAKAQKQSLETQWAQALARNATLKTALARYQQATLELGKNLSQNAIRSYELGDIGYVEFLQALERQSDIQTGYLELLFQYNQSVIDLEYKAGKSGLAE